MKATTFLATVAAATAALAGPLGSEHTHPSPLVREVLRRQAGDQCPGGRDFAFCVPWLNTFNCALPNTGPGGFPIADGQCYAQGNQICACWCSCAAEQCEAANLPVPDYC